MHVLKGRLWVAKIRKGNMNIHNSVNAKTQLVIANQCPQMRHRGCLYVLYITYTHILYT